MADGNLGKLVATVEAKTGNFDRALLVSQGQLNRFGRAAESTVSRVGRAFSRVDFGAALAKSFQLASTAAAGAGVALALFARRQFEALDKLGDLSQQTGLAASQISLLGAALEQNGGTAEQAGEGLLTFSRNLGQVEVGTGRLTGLLKKLDPAFLETLKNAGSTSDALRLVADRIAGAATEQEKLAIATAAFGPAGRQFVLLMQDGAEGVDALTKSLSDLGVAEGFDQLVPKVQRFDDSMKQISQIVTSQLTAGLFGLGDGLESIDDAVSDPQFQQNLGVIARGVGEIGAKAIEAAVGLAELFGGLKAFDTLNLQAELANARTALQDFDQQLARKGIDPGRGLVGGETIELGAGAFGPPQTGAASQQHAEAIRLLRERARLLQVVEDLERKVAGATPKPITVASPSSATVAGDRAPDPSDTRAFEAAARERDRELTAAHNQALSFLRELEQAEQAHAGEQEKTAAQITRNWEEATLDQISLLELRREAELANVRQLFAGSEAELAALEEKINETLDRQVDAVVTPFEAQLQELGQFGEQVFGDMVEGWVQGAEVSFDGILKSFAALLLKMEIEALTADIFGSLTGGKTSGGQSLIGGILLGVGGLLGLADGGVVTEPTIAMIGEGGSPEAVIPLPNGLRSLQGGGERPVIVNVSTPQGFTAEVRRTRGPSMEEQIEIAVVGAVGRQMRRNGPLAQTISPNGPTSGLR